MRNLFQTCMAGAVLAVFVTPVRADDENFESTFPMVLEQIEAGADADAAQQGAAGKASELSEAQQKQAQQNLQKTVDIYANVLKYDAHGRVQAIKGNIEFLSARLDKAVAEQQEVDKQLATLRQTFVRFGNSIQQMNLPEDVQAKKLRDLKRETDMQRQYLENRVAVLGRQIQRLETRLSSLHLEYRTFAGDDLLTGADKWDKRDQEATKAALDAIKQTEQQLKEERAAGIQLSK